MKHTILLLSVVFLAAGLGQELLTNGDFEQPITEGWVHTYTGSGTHTADRQTTYHPDADYEAMAYQYDNPGESRLGQTVDVPGPMLLLSFWASFEEIGGTSSCWPAACMSVRYLDAADTKLGETRYFYSTYANWVSDDTLSLIRVTNPGWTEYNLDVIEEVTQHLPGVAPGNIAKVEVALYALAVSG